MIQNECSFLSPFKCTTMLSDACISEINKSVCPFSSYMGLVWSPVDQEVLTWTVWHCSDVGDRERWWVLNVPSVKHISLPAVPGQTDTNWCWKGLCLCGARRPCVTIERDNVRRESRYQSWGIKGDGTVKTTLDWLMVTTAPQRLTGHQRHKFDIHLQAEHCLTGMQATYFTTHTSCLNRNLWQYCQGECTHCFC
jgi:hypothetical protein